MRDPDTYQQAVVGTIQGGEVHVLIPTAEGSTLSSIGTYDDPIIAEAICAFLNEHFEGNFQVISDYIFE